MAVLPKQLIVGTDIGASASTNYGTALGIGAEAFMKRFKEPLDAPKVAAAILSALSGEIPSDVSAIVVSGTGYEPIAG
ncbi:MAG: hypothetical protein JNK04_16560 [Myxococcales bacterium]|nr:hypothetical protein [Myxococcales bacterium]